MAAANPPATLIGSVQRALRLLEAASRSPGGAPAKQLARAAGIPIGTTYHLLRTLSFEGYVRRMADGSYVVGDEILKLLDRGDAQTIVQHSRPALGALRDSVAAAAYLALYEGGEVVVKDIQDCPRTPRIDVWVGYRDAAHATALGKCVLAFLDPAERAGYLARHPPYALTPRTITDGHALLRSLEHARSAELAVDDEEYLVATAGAAVPILTREVIGAVALSFPRRRLAELDRIVPVLRATAAHIARSCELD
jgi:IclR family transcriptional regulator, acetate operon repressor